MAKFLYIVNDLGFLFSHRTEVVEQVAAAGHEVHVCGRGLKMKLNNNQNKIKFHYLPSRYASWSINKNLSNLLSIIRLIWAIEPHVVHLISPEGIIIGGAASKILRVPHLIFSISGFGSANATDNRVSNIRTMFFNVLFFLSTRKNKSAFIFQNNSDRERMLQIRNISKKQCNLILGSGVNLKEFEIKKHRVKTKSFEIRIVMASRLIVQKGIRDFVEAIKIFRETSHLCQNKVCFDLYGEFDDSRQNSITKNELDCWQTSGVLNYYGFCDSMAEVLKEGSIFVYPSFYGEGLPKVLCEAAASGLPIITTDHPGCRDAVVNGKTGLLVPVQSPHELSDAIQMLIADAGLRESMSKQARVFAEKNFDVLSVVEKHMSIYHSMIAE